VDREVELRAGAPVPAVGDVLTWDGEGWIPEAVRTRWATFGIRGLGDWLSTRIEGPDIDINVAAKTIGRGGDSVLVFDSGGDPVVEYDPKKIGQLRENKTDCIYGDASNEDVLQWAGVKYAHLIIVAISDTLDAENAINHCHNMNPDAYIIARAYGNFDKERIAKFANDVIISEEVAGKRMAWHVLRNLGLNEESIKQDIEIVEHEPVSVEDEDVDSS